MNRALAQTITEGEIRDILGPVDDDVIVAIMQTGAVQAEVLEAFEWLHSDEAAGKAKHSMTPQVYAVYDILERDRDFLERDRD